MLCVCLIENARKHFSQLFSRSFAPLAHLQCASSEFRRTNERTNGRTGRAFHLAIALSLCDVCECFSTKRFCCDVNNTKDKSRDWMREWLTNEVYTKLAANLITFDAKGDTLCGHTHTQSVWIKCDADDRMTLKCGLLIVTMVDWTAESQFRWAPLPSFPKTWLPNIS